MDKNLLEIPITIYSELTPYNQVLSKARCRIFYKYENRNGTYITDEYSEKLLKSAAYVPVKGIYIEDDFSDHGYTNSQGRIYGIVPENPNISWEEHIDEDGITREYACCDVLLFTALYGEEGKSIVGKSLSMELYEPSLQYHRAIYNGLPYIVFEEGCFLGLQVLGDEVTPCFQGAAFYSYQDLTDTIETAIEKIKQYTTKPIEGGKNKMELEYKLSDNAKFNALWQLLNPNFQETWELNYEICDVYDDYALVYSCKNRKYERVYYTKNDADDSVEITEHVTAYVIDVTEQEKSTIDTLRILNGDTYELVNEDLTNAAQNSEKVSEFETKNSELNQENGTLKIEIENQKKDFDSLQENFNLLQDEKDQLESKINDLTSQNEELVKYKEGIERTNKETVLKEYEGKLSEETLKSYQEKIDDFSLVDLDKELAYELKKINFSLFETEENILLPKDQEIGGIEEILANY